jgi:lysophospholipase L1-like esterase
MKKMLFRAGVLTGVLAAFLAAPAHSQTPRYRKYVALGDSLTAAVEGNCLVRRHQERSYPKRVADALGIGDFQQPLISERAVSSPTGVCLGAVVAGGTITVGAVSQQGVPTNATLARPYDNLGIPGANAAHLVDLRVANPAGDTANRFAAAILRNFPGGPFEGSNAVEEATLLQPDIVSVWIGPNDVLGAALAGAAIDGVTLTPAAVFEAKYSQILTGVRNSENLRTVIALNVPDVTALAFVRTIPPVVVNPTTRQPVLVNGNPVPLLGPRTTSSCSTPPCPIPPNTLVTLGASALLAQGLGIPASLGGTGLPLPDGSFTPPSTLSPGVLLYADETALIQQRTTEINSRIASVAASNGATVLDIHALFDEIVAHGYDAGGGIVVTTTFLTGGIFSADGFHPSNIGYAIVAKEIIEHLNAATGNGYEVQDFASTLFEPDVPVITTTGVVDPAAGPFGFSLSMWKELVRTTSFGDFEMVYPSSGKRAKRLIER